MKQFKQSFLSGFLAALAVAITFLAGFFTREIISPSQIDFPVLVQAYKILAKHALADLPHKSELEYGMIRGMVDAFGDPYTVFVAPPQHELESNVLQGSYGGIGADLNVDPEGNIVLFPIPGGPAEKAGILPGDRLHAVDGEIVQPGTAIETVQAALRGDVGDKITLSVSRQPETEPLEFTVLLEVIALPTVTWHIDLEQPSVGILKINLIAASTPDEIQKGAAALAASGAQYYVLDLRGNGGGLLNTGVDTARLFLEQGVVIEQQYRGRAVESFNVEQPGALTDLPLVVLIDQGTASAAEIIAGALQAQGRAKLVGTPSFGKNTIQLVFNLRDDSSLHVTAAKWWIPGLEFPTPGQGLQPDILVDPASEGLDPILRAGVQAVLVP